MIRLAAGAVSLAGLWGLAVTIGLASLITGAFRHALTVLP